MIRVEINSIFNGLPSVKLEQELNTDVLDKIQAEVEIMSNTNLLYWPICDIVGRNMTFILSTSKESMGE